MTAVGLGGWGLFHDGFLRCRILYQPAPVFPISSEAFQRLTTTESGATKYFRHDSGDRTVIRAVSSHLIPLPFSVSLCSIIL
jgi:hypothetical protein